MTDKEAKGPAAPWSHAEMNVIFVEPSFPANQSQFVGGLREAGATVIGIGERPKEWLDDEDFDPERFEVVKVNASLRA